MFCVRTLSLSPFWWLFSRWTWVSRCLLKQRMVEVVVTTGAISHAKLQSNHHHQQTNIQFFYRPDALPVTQPTVSKHWRECVRTLTVCIPTNYYHYHHQHYYSLSFCSTRPFPTYHSRLGQVPWWYHKEEPLRIAGERCFTDQMPFLSTN